MDVNDLRAAVTLLSFLAFMGIFFWAWRRAQAESFAAAAQLPFADADTPAQGGEPS